jgi:voltage-gated potassium channel
MIGLPESPVMRVRRRPRASPWTALFWRVALVAALVGVALAANWFWRAGLRDNAGGPVGFVDVLYFTIMTVTTVGYGDIVPVTNAARLFDTLALTPIRLLVWLIFIGTAYDFLLKGLWERWRMTVIQRNLAGHAVIAGYGASGAEAADELIRRGAPATAIVAVDCAEAATAAGEARGLTVVQGDATRNATLEAVRIDKARSIIVCAGRDDTSILIVLTARRLAPSTPISAVIFAQDNEALATQAGATTVINPTRLAGQLLAGSTQGSHLAETMGDLADSGGALVLRERRPNAHEIGRPLSAVRDGAALRLYRGGRAFGFWEAEAQAVEAADLIVEAAPRDRCAP